MADGEDETLDVLQRFTSGADHFIASGGMVTLAKIGGELVANLAHPEAEPKRLKPALVLPVLGVTLADVEAHFPNEMHGSIILYAGQPQNGVRGVDVFRRQQGAGLRDRPKASTAWGETPVVALRRLNGDVTSEAKTTKYEPVGHEV